MGSKLCRAGEILTQNGARALVKESGLYALRNSSIGRNVLVEFSKRQVAERKDKESTLNDLLDTVLDIQPGIRPYHVAALQLHSELGKLARLVDKQEPKTVMEIGTANGGTLYTWCRYLETVESTISLDLPGGRFGGGYPAQKMELYRTFDNDNQLHFIRGNSHNDETFERLRSEMVNDQVTDGEIDFLFIDGDHTYDGVRQDFEMYSELVADDGIVALHDIVETCNSVNEARKRRRAHPDVNPECFNWSPSHLDTEVHQFWQELKNEYQTEEFVEHPAQTAYGIGVVYL